MEPERVSIRKYRIQIKNHILTTRFNSKTWMENENYRKTKMEGSGCAYGVPKMIATTIPVGSEAFVLEMNNDLNKIMGIGKVRNSIARQNSRIHERGDYNFYIYAGTQRIDRTEMSADEERILCALDILCFRGSSHIKRGQGMLTFPLRIQYRCLKIINLTEFLAEMFRSREAAALTPSAYIADFVGTPATPLLS